MAKDFKINKQGIRKMTRDLERELAKNPVRVPIEADTRGTSLPPAQTVNNYNGPVVNVTGDNAQLAWGNKSVNQSQEHVEQVAPGYEQLAQLVTDLLANLAEFPLEPAEHAQVRKNAEIVLLEVTKLEPDKNAVQRGVTMLKGLLAPIASGVRSAVESQASQRATELIDSLGNVPS